MEVVAPAQQLPAREPLLKDAKSRRPDLTAPVKSETVEVAGHPIEAWNDQFFRKIRQAQGVPDNFLNQWGEDSVDLGRARVESKLGKGGDAQFISKDAKFVIKSISGEDQKSLLQRAEAYAERLSSGKSLLVPIYLHFRLAGETKAYIVMRNLTSPTVKWDEKYDLKGCADDKTVMLNGELIAPVHKRFWRVDMWCRCMWTKERHRYFAGKERARGLRLDFPMEQRDEIVGLVQDDAQWLIDQGLMDYSLFVAIRRVPKGMAPKVEPGSPGSPLRCCSRRSPLQGQGQANTLFETRVNGGCPSGDRCARQWAMIEGDTAVLVTISIIDFLQPWTAAKKVAKCIKSLEFNKATIPPEPYGARFQRHFAERFRGSDKLKAFPPNVAVAI